MKRRPPISTRTDPLFPYTTLFRSTIFLAPTGFGGGLNSISLGLIRALENAGLKVGFFKPIAQPFPVDQGRERSCILVERTLNLTSPEPLPLEQVERQRSEEHTSELQSLMRLSYAVFCLKKKN